MWLIILVVTCCILALIFIESKSRQRANEGFSKNVTIIGLLDFIRIALRKSDSWFPDLKNGFKDTSQGVFVGFKLPFSSQGEAYVKLVLQVSDLKFAKKIMNGWPERISSDHYINTVNKSQGLLFGCEEQYKTVNRSLFKILHQLDFFKPHKIEYLVKAELDCFFQVFDKKVGREAIICPHRLFQGCTFNVIWRLVVGGRFEYGDPKLQVILDAAEESNRRFSLGHSLADVFPFVVPIFAKLYKLTYASSLVAIYELLTAVLKTTLEEKMMAFTYEDDNEVTCVADGFIKEMKRRPDDKLLNVESIVAALRDLTLAGEDTTSSILEFALLYIPWFPDVQAKVQQEIADVVGYSRLPNSNDKKSMPYTQAVLLEVLRMASIVPATSRYAHEHCNIDGVELPKGTIVRIKMFSMHRSSHLWESPYEFNPDRFLNENNEIVNQSQIIPFGFGKRSCTGEPLAQVTLFLAITTLFQRYKFDFPQDIARPSFKTLRGMSRSPEPFFVRIRRTM